MNYDSFEIAMLIKEIYSSTVEKVSEGLKESGLTHQQITVIKLIAHKGKVTVKELCDEMSLSKGTVSGIVSRLENMGYIEKFKDEKDKRNTYIIFSKKGIDFARTFKYDINNSFDSIFENFTHEEVKEIRDALLKLRDKIK
ncbi:MarR family winged helix-turn-helix transcriptional regulator [Clostridium sp. LIBA-8841]|uniref:MarR family winged helix-turn-helix transcriptional regulator n=1 Tax=Clostridium sp. LIBA-8841 TaxID=2987530 RepID=UPI002AC40E16|nr:MarR family winged helix-turn-helix transcriptional regulator [Clostridium sp. LIBA-8841]MDZ5253577.1 MarR family winged helix-turn-helix transcriptional regulator [Clostridium sp. LIBA-8841]